MEVISMLSTLIIGCRETASKVIGFSAVSSGKGFLKIWCENVPSLPKKICFSLCTANARTQARTWAESPICILEQIVTTFVLT